MEKRLLLLGLSASSLKADGDAEGEADGDGQSTSMLSFREVAPRSPTRGRSDEIGEVSILSLKGSYCVALNLDGWAEVEKGGGCREGAV